MTVPIILFAVILAAALSLTAFVMSLVIPVSRPVLRRLLPTVFVLAVFILFLAAAGTAYLLWLERVRPLWLFPITSAVAAAYLVGALAIMMLGNRAAKKSDPSGYWPRFALLGLAVIVTGLAFYVYTQVETHYRRAMAEARVQATSAAKTLLPMVPQGGENALVLYDEAFEAVKQSGVSIKALLAADPAGPESVEMLQRLEPILNAIRKAASTPVYSEKMDENRLLSSPHRNYQFVHILSGLVVFSAKFNAANGNPDAAWRDVETLAGMGEHFRHVPVPIALFVASTLEKYRDDTIEYVLNKTEEFPESWPAFPLPASGGFFRDDLARVIKFEEAVLVQYIAGIGAEGYPSFTDAIKLATVQEEGQDLFAETLLPLVKFYWPLFLQPADVDSVREIMTLVGGKTEEPYIDYRKTISSTNQYFETRPNGIGLATSLMIPSYSPLYRVTAQSRARRRTASMALACKAFRIDNGRYPKDAAELSPKYLAAVPVDPIDGGPMKLETGPDGVYIHSAVADGLPDIGIRLAR